MWTICSYFTIQQIWWVYYENQYTDNFKVPAKRISTVQDVAYYIKMSSKTTLEQVAKHCIYMYSAGVVQKGIFFFYKVFHRCHHAMQFWHLSTSFKCLTCKKNVYELMMLFHEKMVLRRLTCEHMHWRTVITFMCRGDTFHVWWQVMCPDVWPCSQITLHFIDRSTNWSPRSITSLSTMNYISPFPWQQVTWPQCVKCHEYNVRISCPWRNTWTYPVMMTTILVVCDQILSTIRAPWR